MKPFKTLFMLLTAVVLLTASSACTEDEWDNLTDDQKLIESLLYQPQKKISVTYNLVTFGMVTHVSSLDPNLRCVWIDSGEAMDSLIHETEPFNSIEKNPVLGYIMDLESIRSQLSVSGPDHITLHGCKVIAIEDVRYELKVTSDREQFTERGELHPLRPMISVQVESTEDIDKLLEIVKDLGITEYDITVRDDYSSILLYLPLGIKNTIAMDYINRRMSTLLIDPAWCTFYYNQI